MNQVFDFNRWMLLTGKHWNENRKKYLLSLAAIAALLLIWFLFMLMVERRHPMEPALQKGAYFVGLILSGCLFGSLLFSDLAGGPRAINYLSVPASVFEKWLTALLFGVLIFFISYTIIFYLVDIPLVKIANSIAANKEIVANIFTSKNDGLVEGNILHNMLLIYVALQGAFILGSLYFPTYSFIKTSIALLVIFIFFLFYIGKVMGSLMPAGSIYESLTIYRVDLHRGPDKLVRLPEWVDILLTFLFKYSIGPFFWVVTYFRLKEKEV